MISTELDSRRVAAPDERATLLPTGGACSSLATAVRLQRLDGLLDNDKPKAPHWPWSRPPQQGEPERCCPSMNAPIAADVKSLGHR
jgi:hypothetical protein